MGLTGTKRTHSYFGHRANANSLVRGRGPARLPPQWLDGPGLEHPGRLLFSARLGALVNHLYIL